MIKVKFPFHLHFDITLHITLHSVIILHGFVNNFNLSWSQIEGEGLLQRQSENMRLDKIFSMPTKMEEPQIDKKGDSL